MVKQALAPLHTDACGSASTNEEALAAGGGGGLSGGGRSTCCGGRCQSQAVGSPLVLVPWASAYCHPTVLHFHKLCKARGRQKDFKADA